MSFRMKSWYFESDCPFCTRSASSFSRDPLYFFAHAMRVKWWYHAKFQPFQSSFEMLFSFRKSERIEKWWCGFEWCILNAKKVWSCNKFKKWSAGLCNRWVFVRNPDTSKEIVQFVHEVHPVFAVTISTPLHMLCGWNDDTMPSSNIFRFHFVVIFNFTVI